MVNLTGRRFGRLVVIEEAPRPSKYVRCWSCRCDCGTIKTVAQGNLLQSRIHSCGCLHDEVAGKCNKTHGLTGTPEYRVWGGMWTRCRNKHEQSFQHYGARGIQVCDRWRSFEHFLADMGPRPSAEHSIDRLDVNGDYTPENCRWATQTDQARNRRTNRIIEHDGETRTLAEWSELTGISIGTLWWRLEQDWSPSRILETPVRRRAR